MPVDRKGDGRVAQHAEVESIVRVLPDVFAAHNSALAEGLLESGMELVAETGLQRSRYSRSANQQRSKHGVRASFARKNQVLIERRLQRARIADAQTVPMA